MIACIFFQLVYHYYILLSTDKTQCYICGFFEFHYFVKYLGNTFLKKTKQWIDWGMKEKTLYLSTREGNRERCRVINNERFAKYIAATAHVLHDTRSSAGMFIIFSKGNIFFSRIKSENRESEWNNDKRI